MMDEASTRNTILRVIEDIQEQNAFGSISLKDELKIVDDLGFASLDVAQLVATLELELGVDPFSAGVAIVDVVTIGDLCEVYVNAGKSGRQSDSP